MRAIVHRMPAALLAAVLCGAPAWGQEAERAGAGAARTRDARDDHVDPRARAGAEVGKGQKLGARLKPGAYIGERHRVALRKAWKKAYGDGQRCPPGLVRKDDGCEAPGAAMPWTIGEKLPAAAGAKPLPQAMRAHLPKLPEGHRYVLVGGDLLLVATGSGMVVDAVEALGR